MEKASKILCKAFPFLCGMAILATFSVLYAATGLALSRTSAFTKDDVLFELDTPRAIGDMTMPQANHYRTTVHPLYVLMVNPWGTMLRNLVGREMNRQVRLFHVWLVEPDGEMRKKLIGAEVNAAVLLNSFLGAAGVALGFVFFRLCTKRLVDAVLAALVFGLSASQLILSAVPDTASLAVCSLLVTYILFWRTLETGRPRLRAWIPAGVFSLGVTTTNFAQTVICFAVCAFAARGRQHGGRHPVVGLLGLVGGVLAIASVLALLQRALYPSSSLFFLPEAYREEMDYSSLQILHSPLPVVVQLFRNFSWINFIVPDPTSHALPHHRLPGLTFGNSLDFGIPGIIASLAWAGLWIAHGFGVLRRRRTEAGGDGGWHPLVLGLLLCLVGNIVLHSFYGVGEKGGIEYFLYTGNFTFLVLALATLPPAGPKGVVRALLLALIVFMGINNLLVARGIADFFAGF